MQNVIVFVDLCQGTVNKVQAVPKTTNQQGEKKADTDNYEVLSQDV